MRAAQRCALTTDELRDDAPDADMSLPPALDRLLFAFTSFFIPSAASQFALLMMCR